MLGEVDAFDAVLNQWLNEEDCLVRTEIESCLKALRHPRAIQMLLMSATKKPTHSARGFGDFRLKLLEEIDGACDQPPFFDPGAMRDLVHCS
jgi:hypothetical protein